MDRPHLSVLIPAFREERRIAATLHEIIVFLHRQPYTSECIVVDDGSDDDTCAVIGRVRAETGYPIQLERHTVNRGKGAAVQTGMQLARGAYTLFTDADNATPIAEAQKLLAAAAAGADIAIGSRYVSGSDVRKRQSVLRRFMSRGGNALFRLMLGLRLHDTRCGFKLFTATARQTVFPRQTLARWGFDTEILVIAALHGLRIVEVPVVWYDRERSTIHPVRDSLRSFHELYCIARNKYRGVYTTSQPIHGTTH